MYVSAGTLTGGGTIPLTPQATTPERDLVGRAQAGDLGAFEALYRAHVNRVYALSYRLSGSPDLAEELTQEVFVRAWRKLGSFRGASAFSTWLHPLTVNVALSERRTRRRREARVTTTDDPATLERETPPVPSGHRLDLERALATLPEGAREVFVLHDVYGYTHEEVAKLTSTTRPIRIYSMIKHGSPPLINALSSILLEVTFVAVWFSQRLTEEKS